MSAPTLPRPARCSAIPVAESPGGDTTETRRPTTQQSMPDNAMSVDAQDTRQATVRATPSSSPPAGADTHPTVESATPTWYASGGAQLAGRHANVDIHRSNAASEQPTDRRGSGDTQSSAVVGSSAGQDPAATPQPSAIVHSLLDPALALAADVLDDTERVLIANQNRLRQLTRSAEDSDGETRGLGLDERHPDVARLAAIVAMLDTVTRDATKNLEKHMRRHPLHPWAKSMRGVGDKQIARLLAAIGDPYIRPEIVRDDGTVLPEGPRTVSALWAYCGLHVLPASGHKIRDDHVARASGRDQLPTDHHAIGIHREDVGGDGGDFSQPNGDARRAPTGVAPKRARGQKANWSTKAKTKAYLIATSCLKQLVKPCHAAAYEGRWLAVHYDECRCSPYRVVYDHRRAHTATTQPDWTDGHSHQDALRVASKEILKDLWREARDWHEVQP